MTFLSQAANVEEIEVRLRTVLNRCRELGVTVSQSKFHIGESVNFVGYKISTDGIRSSDKKPRIDPELPYSHLRQGRPRIFWVWQIS